MTSCCRGRTPACALWSQVPPRFLADTLRHKECGLAGSQEPVLWTQFGQSSLVTLAGRLPGTPGVEGGHREAQDGQDEAPIPTPAPAPPGLCASGLSCSGTFWLPMTGALIQKEEKKSSDGVAPSLRRLPGGRRGERDSSRDRHKISLWWEKPSPSGPARPRGQTGWGEARGSRLPSSLAATSDRVPLFRDQEPSCLPVEQLAREAEAVILELNLRPPPYMTLRRSHLHNSAKNKLVRSGIPPASSLPWAARPGSAGRGHCAQPPEVRFSLLTPAR